MTKRCLVWWCEKPHYANGFCKAHDTAVKRYGSPYGKHAVQMKKIEEEILKARLIAIRLTEFVATEFGQFVPDFTHNERVFTWETHEIPKKIKCPFCEEEDGKHKPLCAVELSKSLLKDTEGTHVI